MLRKLIGKEKNKDKLARLELLEQAMSASPEKVSIYQLESRTNEFLVIYENRATTKKEPTLSDERLKEFLLSSLESGKPFRKKLEWNLDTDRYQAAEWTGVRLKNDFVLLQERSITISSLELEVMRQEISSDWLTSISNRKSLNAFLDEKLQSFEGEFMFGIFDLNGFKQINDSYGHLAGDKVLREIARVATTWSEEDGIVARVGGDEFAFFQPITDKTADQRLQDLQKALAAGDYPDNCKKLVDVAIGAVSGKGNDYKIGYLWAEGDRLMYRSKKSRQLYIVKSV